MSQREEMKQIIESAKSKTSRLRAKAGPPLPATTKSRIDALFSSASLLSSRLSKISGETKEIGAEELSDLGGFEAAMDEGDGYFCPRQLEKSEILNVLEAISE